MVARLSKMLIFRLPQRATWIVFTVLGIHWLGIPAQAQILVEDDFNRKVVLEAPAQRIVSLAPHNTENLFSAGAGGKIVGVVEYSDYPPEANQIQSVGSYIQFNLEAIVSLQPDLIVAWQNGNNRESITRLEQLGYSVYYSEPREFEDIIDNILDLADLAGTRESVDSRVHTVAQTIKGVRQRYQKFPPIDVFYQVWTDPLMTLNGDHFISRVLELCGARNLFAELPIIAPRVSIESVIQVNPDVIITGTVDGVKPDMSLWKNWDVVKAVREKNYVYVDSDVMHRHTLRMLQGISGFCDDLRREN